MSSTLIVIGAGGHARPVVATARLMQAWDEIIILDLRFSGKTENILDALVVGGFELLESFEPSDVSVFVAIGDNRTREEIILKVLALGYGLVNIVHPTAIVDTFSRLGVGCFVGAMAIVASSVTAGNGVIINSAALVEHEVTLGDFSHIAPRALVCGRTLVGERVFVGAGAILIEKLVVAAGVSVGAGTLVIKSVLDRDIKIVGVPGRRL